MTRKLFTFALALLVAGSARAYDFKAGDLYYNIIDEAAKTVEVTYEEFYSSNNYSSLSGAITIPAAVTYNDTEYSVTSIGLRAFYYCYTLTQVTIPNSVTYIGWSAFQNCYALAQVNIPGCVTSIGDYAFCSCDALTQITIPESVESIGSSAFSYCPSLTQVTIPNSVTNIGGGAFSRCEALTAINVESGNTAYCSENGILFNKDKTLLAQYPAGKPGTAYIIPDGVTSIGSDAFYYCKALTQVTIPNSVTSIGNSAFSGCSALTQVTIPNSVTSIGDNTFSSCYSLTQVNIPNSVTSIGDDMFWGCMKLTEITIPNSVENIGISAFSSCSALTQVNIPNSVTSIGNSAFSYCTALTQVDIGNSVTSIGDRAFSYCTALAEITALPTVPPTITASTFSNINLQIKVSIPEESKDAYMADENWKLLLDLSAGQVNGTCGDNLTWTFTTADSTLTISGTGNMYDYSYNNQPWGCFIQSIKNISMPEGLTSIGDDAFFGCSALTQITIPNSVTSIGDDAFFGCSALTQITIPNSVTSIGNSTFSGCSKLTQVTIPESVESIGSSAFYACSALTQVTIPNSLTSIGDRAFQNCSALAEMTVLATVPPTITANTFSNINLQVKVSIPEESKDAYMADENWKWLLDLSAGQVSGTCGDNLTWIFTTADSTLTISGTGEMYNYNSSDQPWYNFYQGIKNISISEGVTSIGNNAFSNYSTLMQITIPDGMTNIGNSAFIGCSALTQVTIPNSVISIESYAFAWCSALMEMTILATVPPTVGTDVFYNVSRDIPVYVPIEALEDYQTADTWKEFNLHAMPTALQTPSMPESIRVYGGMLHNPQGLPVSIYDMQGRMVYSGTAATVSQPAGVYVVLCAGASVCGALRRRKPQGAVLIAASQRLLSRRERKRFRRFLCVATLCPRVFLSAGHPVLRHGVLGGKCENGHRRCGSAIQYRA